MVVGVSNRIVSSKPQSTAYQIGLTDSTGLHCKSMQVPLTGCRGLWLLKLFEVVPQPIQLVETQCQGGPLPMRCPPLDTSFPLMTL